MQVKSIETHKTQSPNSLHKQADPLIRKFASPLEGDRQNDVSFKGIDWFFVLYVFAATKFTEIMTRRMLIRHTLTNFKDNSYISDNLVKFFHSVKLPLSRTQYLPAKRIEKYKQLGIVNPNYVVAKPTPSVK